MQIHNQLTKQINTQDYVTVYLRRYSKNAILLTLPQIMKIPDLRDIVHSKVKIHDENMILFYKGSNLKQNDEIIITDKSILHVVDYQNVEKEQITVYVRIVDGSKRQAFQLNSNTLIKNFMKNEFFKAFRKEFDEVFFVYVGKELDISKTFFEELIQDNSEIICMNNNKRQVGLNALRNINESKQQYENIKTNETNVKLEPILRQDLDGRKLINIEQKELSIKCKDDKNQNEKEIIALESKPKVEGFIGQVSQKANCKDSQPQDIGDKVEIEQQLNLQVIESGKGSSYKDLTPTITRCQIFDQRVYFSESDQAHFLRSLDAQTENPDEESRMPTYIQILSPTLKPGDLIYSAEDVLNRRQTFMQQILSKYSQILGVTFEEKK